MNSLGPWFDYTVNGLVVGNIYALLAVGLALIYGVSHLINFAHGSVYMTGAYIGWLCVTYLHTPLPVTLAIVIAGSALLGVAIERIGLRPLQGSPRIAPLLATIGIGLVLDQVMQLLFTPDPRGLPLQVPAWRLQIGDGTIGALDLLIAGIGLASAALLYGFLRFTRLGWAVRATALDREAAQQVGVDVNRVNMTVFAIAAALGGVSGFLVGMYYNSIDPNMGFQAGLKGIIAQMIGGMGNVPGAIAGSLLLGLTESYGIAAFGTSYRNLFAFVAMILVLVWKPNGIFARGRALPAEPLTGTFIAPSAPVRIPAWLIAALALAALALPLLVHNGYVLQTLGIGWLYAILAISLTLVAGTAGMISLGQAGLLAIGAYASGLLAIRLHLPVSVTVAAAGLITALIGTLIIFPAFRLRGHYVTIATLGVGEIVTLTILNWDSLTNGPVGLTGIPPLAAFGMPLVSGTAVYEVSLIALIVLALLQWRLLASHLGRTLRAIRDDDVAARSYGIALDRYKGLAFGIAGFAAGIAGALMAHVFSYVNHETFTSQVSLLALTMVILGGLGNVAGAILGAVTLVSLPELFRALAEYRMLIYGVALLLLIRFRPQGLLGTV
ncbi:MAG TPA: ABC transporter permease [Xanthobacteraceae bacterium]|nr:ABC transporter permease [Xanthobacteraceae bacterium]